MAKTKQTDKQYGVEGGEWKNSEKCSQNRDWRRERADRITWVYNDVFEDGGGMGCTVLHNYSRVTGSIFLTSR